LPPSSPTPAWAILPFVAYLVLLAVLPLVVARWWERNRNKLLFAVVVSLPVVVFLVGHDGGGAALGEAVREYVAFMALLAALFVISGGIYLRGTVVGTPVVNTLVLAIGALLGSVVGTTGASALLIRPLLRANAQRAHCKHLVVFFIFIVANGAGLLTPLGDPPLFLGFLRGVPFTWTLRLLAPWALSNGTLLAIFFLLERALYRREPPRVAADAAQEPITLEGWRNVALLAGVVAAMFLAGGWRVVALVALAALSAKTTPPRIHQANRFSWAPMREVAVVFVGIFVTMVPALAYLARLGPTLGLTRPWQFFWASGALSSVLDNAPTYLTFASLASGVTAVGSLAALAAHPTGQQLLAAVSCGSVMMGAVTYIGNGPNFMVKAIAEQHHVRMPGFFGYTLWSLTFLMPLFAVVALVFFR
jgi:Na+/H+ antiporter NhaD/arsenite permease-like protein